ncbi:MAG: tRNA pseudouridine(38-40) synthase TruA [Eubacterium sp.]|nr:tRNA pseudouridine(38-40) synthase TruA [Eubacterium sp.]
MRRIMLRVSYDGTGYSGWQEQENAITIERELNTALSSVTGEEISVIGASRTDAGVHAEGAVCVFDTDSRIPAEKFSYAANTRLPEAVRVWESTEVEPDFHPRHCSSEKTYEYRIWNDKFDNPLMSRYTHFIYRDMDVEAMNEAAKCLVGEHDFKSYCSTKAEVLTTVREIVAIGVERDPAEKRLVRITVTGKGFLYNMVRIIAGTLIEVGTGLRTVDSVKETLQKRDRESAGPTAPAKGLVLKRMRFL